MQAIITKFHGPSNVKGSRVSAKADAGRIILDWDHRLNSEQNHFAAARALAEKLGWNGRWCGGGGEFGYVFVNAADPRDCFDVGKP